MVDDRSRDARRVANMDRGPERDRAFERLSAEDQAYVADADWLGELVRESVLIVPPRASDPIAAMLGLVPDPSLRLDGAKFAKRCKARGQKPNSLAAALADRGWRVSAADVFRWQNGNTSDVHPALMQVVAELLSTNVGELSSESASGLDSVVSQISKTSEFDALVQRFARARSMTADVARSALTSRMLAAAHRGDEADAEQMLQSIEVLVSAVERR